MIDISRKGIFTVLPPYFLPAVEYEVIAVQSISAMLTVGLDPFKLVYRPVGLDESFYLSLPRTTQICLLKSSTDVRYIPREAIVHEDTTSYVNYVDKTMVIHLGGHPQGAMFTNLIRTVAEVVSAGTGVSPIVEVRDTSQSTQLNSDNHTLLQTERQLRITQEKPLDTSLAREQEIKLLNARIHALEQFLIQFSQECGTGTPCALTETLYTSQTVFYQYSLGDYVMQSARGDIHDLPINNAFIDMLHGFNVADTIYLN